MSFLNKKGKNAISGGIKETKLNLKEVALFIFIIGIHTMDAFADFPRRGGSFMFILTGYLLLSVFAVFMFKEKLHKDESGFKNLFSDIGLFLIPSAISIFIPLFRTYINLTQIDFVLVFFPGWLLFFIVQEHLLESKWIKNGIYVFLIFWIVVALIHGINTLDSSVEVGVNQIRSSTVIGSTMKFIKDSFTNLKNLVKVPEINVADFYNKTVAELTGERISGQAEDAKYRELGVFIDNIKSLQPVIYEGETINVWADLKVKTLGDEETTIINACAIEEYGSIIQEGTIYPSELRVTNEAFEMLDCEIEPQPKGNYIVEFSSKFGFNTLAYIPYYFVNKNLITSYRLGSKDVNKELDIPKEPIATYTPGPLEVGINSGFQPYSVDPSLIINPTRTTPVFGITLSPDWRNGRLLNLTKLIFAIPAELELEDCKGGGNFLIEEEWDSGYNAYISTDTEVRSGSYKTINCRLKVKNPSQLLQGPVNVRTLVVLAEYDYEISNEKSIQIREDPNP